MEPHVEDDNVRRGPFESGVFLIKAALVQLFGGRQLELGGIAKGNKHGRLIGRENPLRVRSLDLLFYYKKY